jgi:hypothetical protein
MTIYLDSEDDRLDINNASQAIIDLALRANQQTVEVNELPPEERSRIERTKASGVTLGSIPTPGFNDRLNPSKISAVPTSHSVVSKAASNVGLTSTQVDMGSVFDLAASSSSRKASTTIQNLENAVRASMDGESMQSIDDAIAQLEIARKGLEEEQAIPRSDQEIIDLLPLPTEELVDPHVEFPHLAREIMNLGLGMEKYHTESKLNMHKKEGDEYKAKIDLLIKLSAQLPRMNSDDGSYELKEEARVEIIKIAEELKAKGIDIFPGMEVGDEFTKEQLAAANSLVNHNIDVSRTSLQELFTTKISVSIQFLQMMTEVMKKVSDYDDRQKRKALEISR